MDLVAKQVCHLSRWAAHDGNPDLTAHEQSNFVTTWQCPGTLSRAYNVPVRYHAISKYGYIARP